MTGGTQAHPDVASSTRPLLQAPDPTRSPDDRDCMDRAYLEYCRRIDAGEKVDLASFCRGFPGFEAPLEYILGLHEFLMNNPELVTGAYTDWPEPGQEIDRFAVLAELGRGAFGRVYLVREIDLAGRLSVIKVSADGLLEAGILGRLDHPNIVPIHSVRRDPVTGWSIICMPYLGSVTLSGVLGRLADDGHRPARARAFLDAIWALSQGLPDCDGDAGRRTFLDRARFDDGVVYLAWQLAEGLAYAHSKGICHSDLKPSNVLLTPGGRAMLLDFNLAYDLQWVRRRVGGTVPYMAPEQLRAMARRDGGQAAVDHRSDIFSLGAILYELLAGRPPFAAVSLGRSCEEICEELAAQRQHTRAPVREVNPSIDPALAGLVERCLAFDPADRPTAGRLAAALRRHLWWPQRARRWRRRHSRWFAATAVSCVLLAGGEAYALLTRPPYPVRQLNEGWENYSQGRFEAARASFTRAAERDEGLANAYFGRARALEKMGRGRLALEDYDRAVAIRPDPQVLACRAYCRAVEGFFEDCIQDSTEALNAGFLSASVYNNLGFCYLRRNQFALARQSLDESLRIDPGLRQASRNRALAELQWAMCDPRHPLDVQAVADIETAIAAGPPTASLFLDAARILSRAGEVSGRDRQRIAQYLGRALDLGADPVSIRADFPAFIGSLPADAASASARPAARNLADHLIDPLPLEPEL